MLEKYKRPLVALGLSIFFLLSGMLLMELNMEFSGVLFFISAFTSIFYLPILRFFKKRKNSLRLQTWLKKEVWILSLLICSLCLIGTIESYPNNPEFILLFISILIFALLFGYLHLKNSRSKGPYLLYFIGNGILLMLFVDYFGDEEPFEFAILIYFGLLFLSILRWTFGQIKLIIELKNEKAKTELMHLQSQVNPHFFFNTLNNLYGWVEKDPKTAKQLILNLSDMMRYSIYDGQKDLVKIEEEVDYLKNYIELHKMRYHKKIKVNFEVDIQSPQKEIMPLLFIILLENAFKHGVENLRENAFVNIALIAKEKEVFFTVENNFDPEALDERKGIGLKNLKRRLVLGYPNQHELRLSSNQNIYKSELRINLNA